MINWKELFDFENDGDIKKAIDLIKQLLKTMEAAEKASTELKQKYSQSAKELVNSSSMMAESMKKVGTTSEQNRKEIIQGAAAAEKISKEYTVVSSSISVLDANTKKLNEDNGKLRVSMDTLNKVYLSNQKLIEQKNLQESALQKTNVKLNLQLQERKAALKQQAKEELGLIDAYQKESQTLNTLRKTYKAVATEYGVGSKQAKALRGEVTRLDEKLKAVDASAGQNQRSVGAYGNAMKNTLPIMGSFGGQIGLISTQLGMIKTAILGFKEAQIASAAATGASSGALKAFRVALIGTGIGAIVVAIGALVAAFASTQEGADKMSKALAPIKGAFQGIIGVAQNLALNVFPLIGEKFDVFVKKHLNGLDYIRLGWNKITGDTEEYEQIQADIAKRSDEINESNKKSEGYIQGIKDAWNGAGDAIRAASEAQVKLTNLQIELEKAQIRSIVPLAKMREEYESLRSIAQDQGNTDAERIKALNDAEKVQRRIAATERDLLAKEIAILELKQSQNDTDREGQRELQELKAKQFEADTAAQKKINSLISLRSSIEKRQAAERQKALDEEAKKLAEINNSRAYEIEAINKRILKSSEELVQSRIEEEIRLADFQVKTGEEKLLFLQKRIDLEISLERRKSAELIKIKDDELKEIEKKRNEELSNVKGNKALELAVNKKYDDILAQTKEAQKVEIIKIQEDLENKVTQVTEKGTEERNQITLKEAQERLKLAEEAVGYFNDLGNSISGFAAALKERQDQDSAERLDNLEKNYQEQLSLVGDNEEAKLIAEKNYQAQKDKIQKEQARKAAQLAKFDKALSISQAIVNTGLAITKVLGQTGIFGIPLVPIVAALGAIQVATIAAQPIPQYFKGTDNAEGGLSIVGEIGREMVIEPTGKTYLTGDKAELRDIPKGSQILTNVVTENILKTTVERNNSDSENISKGVYNEKKQALSSGVGVVMDRSSDKIIDGFSKTIQSLPITNFNLGRNGIRKDVRIGNTIYKDVEQENKF